MRKQIQCKNLITQTDVHPTFGHGAIYLQDDG